MSAASEIILPTGEAAPAPAARRVDLVNVAILLFAALGVALRLRQFLFNRSLWGDESALGMNLVQRDFGALLGHPLAGIQSAPPGFLVAGRVGALLFGASDWGLRIVPLLAGLITVGLAVLLARRELRSAAARILFVALVALSPVLVYYASELKQYASDAEISLAFLVALSYRRARWGAWALAIIGYLGILSSLPAILIAAPAGLLLAYESLKSGRWRATIWIGIAWAAAAALHGLYTIHSGVDRAPMLAFWHGHFAPLLPWSARDLLWYPRSFGGLVYLGFRNGGIAFPFSLPEWSDWLTWCLAIGSLAAIAIVLAGRRPLAIVAVAVLPLAVILSGLMLYPFSSRLLLYYVPLVFFILATAVDAIAARVKYAAVAAAAALIAALTPAASALAVKPYTVTDLRGALQEARDGLKPGDVLAVGAWSMSVFAFYRPVLGLDKVPTFAVPRENQIDSVLDLVRKSKAKRVWFIFGFHISEATDLFAQLSARGKVIEDWSGPGTRALLVDFTQPADPPATPAQPASG